MRSSIGFEKHDLIKIDLEKGYEQGKTITDVLFKLAPSSYSCKSEKKQKQSLKTEQPSKNKSNQGLEDKRKRRRPPPRDITLW